MFIISTSLRRIIIGSLSVLPFAYIVFSALTQQLGTDPAKTIVLFTGTWSIYFLLITLFITPLRRLFGWRWVTVHRRMLGLFALFYATLHFLSYAIFILGLDFARLAAEIVKRPYILAGFPAFLILIVLGATSTQKMMRRLGKNWVKLHQMIYIAIFLVWVHVLLQVRASYQDTIVYGAITLFLLGVRIYWHHQKRQKKAE